MMFCNDIIGSKAKSSMSSANVPSLTSLVPTLIPWKVVVAHKATANGSIAIAKRRGERGQP